MSVLLLCAGPIPPELGNLAMLQKLSVFKNQLTGKSQEGSACLNNRSVPLGEARSTKIEHVECGP